MMEKRMLIWFTSCLAIGFVLSFSPLSGAANPIEEGEMSGYLLVPNEKVSKRV